MIARSGLICEIARRTCVSRFGSLPAVCISMALRYCELLSNR